MSQPKQLPQCLISDLAFIAVNHRRYTPKQIIEYLRNLAAMIEQWNAQ